MVTFPSDQLILEPHEIESLRQLPSSAIRSVLERVATKQGAKPSIPRQPSYRERQKAGDLQRKNKANLLARDVGEIPDIANPQERENAKWDLKYHLERYHGEKFYLGWASVHLRYMKALQKAFLGDAQLLLAIAMPRGSGKTTLGRLSVEWAVHHGHLQWPILIEADLDAFKKQMIAVHSTLKSHELMAADFPETVGVWQQMSSSQAASNMTCMGKPMFMISTTELIVLPTNYASIDPTVIGALSPGKTAGGVYSGGGITGSMRGAQLTIPGLGVVRPDGLMVNDPQTRESAHSPKQVNDRLNILIADALGMAPPGKSIRGACTFTVIANNDVAARLLSHEFPQYRSLHGKWMLEWPTNMPLWQTYGALLRKTLQNLSIATEDDDGDEDSIAWLEDVESNEFDEVNRFYDDHRRPHGPFCRTPGLDCGAKVYWEPRIDSPYRTSIQTFMSWWLIAPSAAMAEGQNDPIDPHEPEDIVYCSREEILEKLSPFARYEVPNEATELVSFIDVQGECLVYCVMAICPGFRRYVVDYGAWPDQKREHWTRASLGAKLSNFWTSPKEAWLQGLIRTKQYIDELPFQKTNGQEMRITLGLVDRSNGSHTEPVFNFCRDFGGGIWVPSQGRGTKANEINHGSEQKAWRKRHVDWGPHWNRKPDHDRGFDWVQHTSDWWKSLVHIGIRTPEHEDGSLQFFQGDHDIVAAHLRAEFPTNDAKDGREFVHWQLRPGSPDNDLFDCISGCGLAASMKKINPPGARSSGPKSKGGRVIGRSTFERARR